MMCERRFAHRVKNEKHYSLANRWLGGYMLERKSADDMSAIMDELVLDIKSLMLLYPTDERLEGALQTLSSSSDPEVLRFISLVQKREKKASEGGYFLMAVGEIILASLLFIGGLALIAPTLLGLGSPEEFSTFVTAIAGAISSQTLTNPLIPVLEFIIALSLLLSAFFTLRAASQSLKETGIPRL
jgi:hypothetical protein